MAKDKGKKMTEDFVPIDELTYEQAFSELETIVAALEVDEHSLVRTMTQFERGQALAKHCMNLLDQAELKIPDLRLSDSPLLSF